MFDTPREPGLAGLPGGPQLAGLLDGRSWADATGTELVDALAACERVMSWAAALQTEVLTELARRRPPGRRDRSRAATVGAGGDGDARSSAGSGTQDGWTRGALRYSTFTADEVAAALGWSWYAADRRLQTAIDLHTRLPQVVDALHEGRIDLAKARAVSEATRGLGAEASTKVALRALRTAADRPLTAFKDAVTRDAYAADPTLAARRHVDARGQRRIVHSAEDDGMCLYGAVLPAGQAALVSSAVTAVARAALAPGDGRTLEQARVDSFVDLLVSGPRHEPEQDPSPEQLQGQVQRRRRGQGRIRAVVNVTVPVTTLLAAAADQTAVPTPSTDSASAPPEPHQPHQPPCLPGWLPVVGADPSRLPGDVDRSGPLDADQAITTALTVLQGGAPIRWIVTDPLGRAVAAGIPGHRRPPWLEHLVQTFDRICRAPGCRAPAEQCDTDHVIPYPRGRTAPNNLASLCRRHHRMKTHTRWRSRVLAGGQVEWTSPTGHVYTTHPGQWLPPLEPPPWIDVAGCGDDAPPDDAPPDCRDGGPPPDPGDPADDPAWWARLGAVESLPLEAAGPDTHPALGDPLLESLPDELLLHPWAPADTTAEDPLAQDSGDPRLYRPLVS